MNHDGLDADLRRAAALLAHHAGNDQAGVNAVIDEAERAGRLRQLAYAIPSVVGSRFTDWHTPAVADALRTAAGTFAMLDEGEDQ